LTTATYPTGGFSIENFYGLEYGVKRYEWSHMPPPVLVLGSLSVKRSNGATSEVGCDDSGPGERCPRCESGWLSTRFDTALRLPDRASGLCFGIPAGLCEGLHQLYIDPELIELLDLGQGRCRLAIERISSSRSRPGPNAD